MVRAYCEIMTAISKWERWMKDPPGDGLARDLMQVTARFLLRGSKPRRGPHISRATLTVLVMAEKYNRHERSQRWTPTAIVRLFRHHGVPGFAGDEASLAHKLTELKRKERQFITSEASCELEPVPRSVVAREVDAILRARRRND